MKKSDETLLGFVNLQCLKAFCAWQINRFTSALKKCIMVVDVAAFKLLDI